MDQVHVIRHKVLVEGRTQRQVARELGISRRTVRKYLRQPQPVRHEAAPRARPVWAQVGPRLETLLAESGQWTGGKQRLTATRLHQLLRQEGHQVGVTVVKEAVAEWKRQRREVMIPLTYRPGDLPEVDFFEVLVEVAGNATEGVVVSAAADVIRPRLRLDLRPARSNQLSGRTRACLRASGRTRAAGL
jgi:transposase